MISFSSLTTGTNMSNRERVAIQHFGDDDDDDDYDIDVDDGDDGIHQSKTLGPA